MGHRTCRWSPRLGSWRPPIDRTVLPCLIIGSPMSTSGPPGGAGPICGPSVVAGAAGVGMGFKLVAFGRLNVTSYVMYPALGWVSVVAMPILVRHLSAGQLALILAGGFAYTVGMVVLWRRWPDPRPRRFGYHEVWHLFTIVAAALHFAAVASVVG